MDTNPNTNADTNTNTNTNPTLRNWLIGIVILAACSAGFFWLVWHLHTQEQLQAAQALSKQTEETLTAQLKSQMGHLDTGKNELRALEDGLVEATKSGVTADFQESAHKQLERASSIVKGAFAVRNSMAEEQKKIIKPNSIEEELVLARLAEAELKTRIEVLERWLKTLEEKDKP